MIQVFLCLQKGLIRKNSIIILHLAYLFYPLSLSLNAAVISLLFGEKMVKNDWASSFAKNYLEPSNNLLLLDIFLRKYLSTNNSYSDTARYCSGKSDNNKCWYHVAGFPSIVWRIYHTNSLNLCVLCMEFLFLSSLYRWEICHCNFRLSCQGDISSNWHSIISFNHCPFT